jgi:uncharacterized membrane protein
MDLLGRKNKFIKQFMEVASVEKLEQLEKILYSGANKIVAYTVQGEPLTKEKYIQKVKKAEKGKFISSAELKKRMLSW